MKKLFLIIFALIFINLTFISAIDIYKQGDCINFKKVCSNCSYINISYTSYPNSSIAEQNIIMTKTDNFYNYSFCETQLIGTYDISYYSNVNDETYSFKIMPIGESLDISQTIIYLGLILILIFLFLLIIFNIPKLPSSDTFNEEGILLGINNLKYLRPVLWAISWGLLLAIMFITSNVGLAYLTNEMIGRFLFTIYRIMFLITLPMAIIWVLYIFAKIWRDKEVKNMFERGIEFKTP